MGRAARWAGFVAALALGGSAGCKGQEPGGYFGSTSRSGKDEATLYITSGAEPEYLDPGLCFDAASTALVLQLFEGLTTRRPGDLRPAPGMAERWERSDDGRRYRFHLRADAKWSDGAPVTALDFEYAWRRVLRPATASRAAGRLYVLKNGEAFSKGRLKDEAAIGVRARDDHTLDVELERPTPYFLDLLSSPTLMPVRRDVIERFGGREALWTRPENIVVNGPYTLDAWKFRYEITMKRSPFYRDRDRLRVHRVVWIEVEDYRSTMNLYKTGEVDLLGPSSALPAEQMPFLGAKRDARRFPVLSTYWYELNTKVKPLDDARVRWALNLAVDKGELVRAIARGGQIPATHYVPEATGSGYAEEVLADKAAGKDPFSAQAMGFDPARARRLLEEAGYPVVREGEELRASGFPQVEVLYNSGEGHRNLAVAIQSMWREHLGVSVTLRSEEWKVMLSSVREGRFQIVRGGSNADYNHPHSWLSSFLSTSPENRSGWADGEYDAMIERAASELDLKKSAALYRAAEARAVSGMSRLPLYFHTKTTLVKPWVKGYSPNPQNVFYAKWAWVDPRWDEGEGRPDEPAYPPEELPPPGRLDEP